MESEVNWSAVRRVALAAFLCLAVIVVLGVGGAAGCKEYNRYQKRADASNAVKVQRTLVEATREEAKRKYEESVGIKRAQDEINKTLTPLYVQHEAIQALEKSGAATVYIPSGEQGVPLVADINKQSVGGEE